MNQKQKYIHKKGIAIAETETRLIKQVRIKNGISRIDLAKELTISPSTAGSYVDRLIHEGFLLEGYKQADNIGRPKTNIILNSEAGYFIGVDFYAKEILAVSMDFSQKIMARKRIAIKENDTPSNIVSKIINIINIVTPNNKRRLISIGIGSPGPVNKKLGIALEYRYIKDFTNIPLVAPVAEQFKVPVYIENTANAMALAELWFGHNRNLNSFACLWIRSGIGAGIIINRQLYCGLNDGAGEIGFFSSPIHNFNYNTYSSNSATNEKHKEIEEIASVRAIIEYLTSSSVLSKKLTTKNNLLDIKQIAEAYHNNDPHIRSVIDATANSLGWAIAQLAFCIAPEQVIIAGPLTEFGDNLLKNIKETVAEYFAATDLKKPPNITLSTLGEFSGALGAAALAIDHWKLIR